MTTSDHLDKSLIELFAMGRASVAEISAIEAHADTCRGCLDRIAHAMKGKDARDLRATLLDPYRVPRATPRELGQGVSEFHKNTDPAPPWVPAVLDMLLPRLYRILAWCAAGDPVARAEQVLTLAHIWPGPLYTPLTDFLDAAKLSKAGKRAGSKYKPVHVVSIPRDWPPITTPDVKDGAS